MNELTAIILTKDEESDLPRCLEALDGFCETVVVDSGSRDRTREIARKYGAAVLEHPFESFGTQRNWALDHNPFPAEWLLFLDADEVATAAFRDTVRRAISEASTGIAGFYCCWRMMLDDVWLKRADNFPKWQLRLLRNGRVRFIDIAHGQKEGAVEGRLEFLREPYLHYAFSKGWSAWVERHNRYSTQEAADRALAKATIRDALVANPSQRNTALKRLTSRIPGWPLLRFIHTYMLRGGFLDGSAGLRYCAMIAYYEFLIQLKMREVSRKT